MMPPLFLKLVIGENGKTKFKLWVPIFLLLPFIFILIVLTDLVLVPLLLIFANTGRKIYCAKVALFEPFRLLGACKGFAVEIDSPYQKLVILVS